MNKASSKLFICKKVDALIVKLLYVT